MISASTNKIMIYKLSRQLIDNVDKLATKCKFIPYQLLAFKFQCNLIPTIRNNGNNQKTICITMYGRSVKILLLKIDKLCPQTFKSQTFKIDKDFQSQTFKVCG